MNLSDSTAIDLAQKLIRIDSSDPGAYEGEIGDFVYQELSSLSIPVYKDEVLPGRNNVMAVLEGEVQHPALVFICHLDTVTLGDGWTRSPLGGEIIDGKLYGRGASDMKSGFACALSAFSSYVRSGKKPKHSLVFIATVDEEDFMRGVERVLDQKWVTKDDWVLDTEPTSGQIQVAHKGRTWFEITVKGVTAHASTPQEGADAIAAMAEVISSIRHQILLVPKHHDLGASTVTFGQIEGGYRPYVVPDSCKVWVDMRLVPPTDTKQAIKIVEKAMEEAKEQVPGVTASYVITGDRPYVQKDENSFLLKKLKEACDKTTGKDTIVSAFTGYTDTAVIASTLGNTNCMSFGPGSLELAHKPDEYAKCEDIITCEKVFKQLIQDMV